MEWIAVRVVNVSIKQFDFAVRKPTFCGSLLKLLGGPAEATCLPSHTLPNAYSDGPVLPDFSITTFPVSRLILFVLLIFLLTTNGTLLHCAAAAGVSRTRRSSFAPP